MAGSAGVVGVAGAGWGDGVEDRQRTAIKAMRRRRETRDRPAMSCICVFFCCWRRFALISAAEALFSSGGEPLVDLAGLLKLKESRSRSSTAGASVGFAAGVWDVWLRNSGVEALLEVRGAGEAGTGGLGSVAGGLGGVAAEGDMRSGKT